MKKLFYCFLAVFIVGFVHPGTAQSKSTIQTTKGTSGPKKKDGTPDMRYKENKQKAKPAKHLKKDGTPDKRFKENK